MTPVPLHLCCSMSLSNCSVPCLDTFVLCTGGGRTSSYLCGAPASESCAAAAQVSVAAQNAHQPRPPLWRTMNVVSPQDTSIADARLKVASNDFEAGASQPSREPSPALVVVAASQTPAAAADAAKAAAATAAAAPPAAPAAAETAAARGEAAAAAAAAVTGPPADAPPAGEVHPAAARAQSQPQTQGRLGAVAEWRLGWRRTCHTMAQALGLRRLHDYIQVRLVAAPCPSVACWTHLAGPARSDKRRGTVASGWLSTYPDAAWHRLFGLTGAHGELSCSLLTMSDAVMGQHLPIHTSAAVSCPAAAVLIVWTDANQVAL